MLLHTEGVAGNWPFFIHFYQELTLYLGVVACIHAHMHVQTYNYYFCIHFGVLHQELKSCVVEAHPRRLVRLYG